MASLAHMFADTRQLDLNANTLTMFVRKAERKILVYILVGGLLFNQYRQL